MSKQKRAEYLEKFNNLINEDEEIHKRPRSSSSSSNTHTSTYNFSSISTNDSTNDIPASTFEGILKY
jgi:23S rRNA maturation mini-RNase III